MLQPLRNYIAVRERELPEKLSAILLLPDQVKEPVSCGEIMAAGPGKKLPNGTVRPMPVKAGERVLFRSRAAKTYFDPKFEQDFMLITDDDVLGVVAA
jgi:chaperonin GroES